MGFPFVIPAGGASPSPGPGPGGLITTWYALTDIWVWRDGGGEGFYASIKTLIELAYPPVVGVGVANGNVMTIGAQGIKLDAIRTLKFNESIPVPTGEDQWLHVAAGEDSNAFRSFALLEDVAAGVHAPGTVIDFPVPPDPPDLDAEQLNDAGIWMPAISAPKRTWYGRVIR